MGKTRVIELGNVLVVGGCGFLGSHVVDQLLNFPSEDSLTDESTSRVIDEDGKPDLRFACPQLHSRYPTYKNTKVSVLDLRTAHNRLPGAEYYDADILSTEDTLKVFKAVKPDVVIDTVSPPPMDGEREMLYKVNVEGTKNLLEIAGGSKGDWGGKCKAFVYTSSASVVHDTQSDLINVDERWPKITGKRQKEYYSETKALAEDLVIKYNGASPSGMLTVAIRPAGIYGERDTTLTKGLVDHATKSSPLVLSFQLGTNDNLFDFTYVGNIAYAHMIAAELLIATKNRAESKTGVLPLDHERADGEAFNITNDSPVYFWDMARSVWALLDRYVEPDQVWELPEGTLTIIGGILETVFGLFGKKPRLSRKEVRYSCMTRYYSCDKAKKRLGYLPIVPLEEGVARSVGCVLEKDRSILAKKTL